jgi:myo-inositol-1(or 4)-monophosphatase
LPETDLQLLVSAAKAAGDIATKHFNASPEIWDKPGDAGPVTEADLEVDRMLRSDLIAARPDYGWLSEETEDDQKRLDQERVFIIDPIDGTRSFIEGSRTWAHSLAIAERGRVIAAVVYLPLRDKIYTGVLGGGATLNGQPIEVSTQPVLNGASVLAAKPNFAAHNWQNGTPDVSRHFRASLAYRLCLVAEGRFDAMLTLRDTWEWDIAAGVLIAQEAGGRTSDRLGEDLVFNRSVPKSKGAIAAGAVVQGDLVRALA